MKKNEVAVGQSYLAKVSGKIVPVTILRISTMGDGYLARNEVSGREIVIKTAARLRAHLGVKKEQKDIAHGTGT